MKHALFAVLKHGAKNAQTAFDVCGKLVEYNVDITTRDLRNLKDEINCENDCGEIIVSGPAGYYIAETDAEIEAYEREYKSRIEQLSYHIRIVLQKWEKRKTKQGSLL